MDPVTHGLYIMSLKNEPQQFMPGLFIGSAHSSSLTARLKEKGVTHILSVGAETVYPELYAGRCLALLDIDDLPGAQLLPKMQMCCEWIDGVLAQQGAVLIHCMHGVSRSGCIAVAYVMWKRRCNVDDALSIVREVRPVVNPNQGFMDQLRLFQLKVLAPVMTQVFRKRKNKGKHQKNAVLDATVLPVLYSWAGCPYALRARMALVYSKIPFVLREVDLNAKPAEMIEASPKGTVPILVCSKVEVVEESVAILEWIHSQFPEMLSSSTTEQISEIEDEFAGCVQRYKYSKHYPEHPKEHYLSKCEEFIAKWDVILSLNAFIGGDIPSFADFVLFPYIRKLRNVSKKWFREFPYTNISMTKAGAFWEPCQTPVTLYGGPRLKM